MGEPGSCIATEGVSGFTGFTRGRCAFPQIEPHAAPVVKVLPVWNTEESNGKEHGKMDIEIMKGVAGAFFTKAQTYTAMRSYRNSSNT